MSATIGYWVLAGVGVLLLGGSAYAGFSMGFRFGYRTGHHAGHDEGHKAGHRNGYRVGKLHGLEQGIGRGGKPNNRPRGNQSWSQPPVEARHDDTGAGRSGGRSAP